MYSDLTLLLESIMGYMSQLVTLYFGGSIITLFFALYIVRKVSKLLKHIY